MLFSGKKSRIFKLAVTGGVCLAMALLISLAYFNWDNRRSEQLESLLDSLTYTNAMRTEEMQKLLDFKEISTLSDFEKAAYYSAQTRIYSMVLGRDVQAMEAFTNGFIFAERSGDHETEAWLYADFAQTFIKNASWQPAINCLMRSLECAAKANMDDQYYAYCYSALAFVHSSVDQSNVLVAKQYYTQAEQYRNICFFTDYPIDILLDMTLAQINLREGNYLDCEKNLSNVKQYIDSCSFVITLDDLYNRPQTPWISRYVLPYYRTATILAVRQGRMEDTLRLIQEGYEALTAYKETNNLILFFLSGILPDVLSSKTVDTDTYQEIVEFATNAAVRYSTLTESNENAAGESLYRASEAAVMRIREEYHATQLYRIMLTILLLSGAVLGIMAAFLKFVHHQANLDGLTGAYNRGCFDRNYLTVCQGKNPFGVILYDIDLFKQYNDSYGHSFGDDVLKRVTALVSLKLTRRHSELYRYGGDEFVIICRKCTPASLLSLAEEIGAAVKEMKLDVGTQVTLSIGTAHSSQTDDVLQLADANVYAAKENGRARVQGSGS